MKADRALMTLFLLAIAYTVAQAKEVVTADFETQLGSADSLVASGFLVGWDDNLSDSLIYPLRPSGNRTLYWQSEGHPETQTMFRADSLDAYIILQVNEYSCGCDSTTYCNADPQSSCWIDLVQEKIDTVLAIRERFPDLTIHYDIWNEPDLGLFFTGTPDEFYEIWRVTYEMIRQGDPQGIITGPSFSGGIEGLGESGTGVSMDDFLEYCDEHDTFPDVLGWHAWGDDDIHAQVEMAKGKLEQYPDSLVGNVKFEINEMMHEDQYRKPGWIVRFFAMAERAKPLGLVYAGRSYWVEYVPGVLDDPFRLGGLLGAYSNERRYAWWTYKAYGDMKGDWVQLLPSAIIDGVAARDDDQKVARVLIGAYASTDPDTVSVWLKGLREIDGLVINDVVHTRVQRIRGDSTEVAGPWVHPATLSDGRSLVFGDSLEIEVTGVGEYDAITIELTPIQPSTVPAPG